MKKTFKNRFVVIFVLVLIMIFTTSISFAFWNAGINGASGDQNININIGYAGRVDTVLNFENSTTPNATLIPVDAPLLNLTDTHEILFVANLYWNALRSEQNIEMAGVQGELRANVYSIIINDANFANITGLNGLPLFVVDILANGTSIINSNYVVINANESVEIYIKISMNRPINRVQYNEIQDNLASLTVNFEVEPLALHA